MTPTIRCSVLSVLQGQKIVVVGGDRREGALTRLRTAFRLADVIHCCTRKVDSSPRCFESSLRAHGVVLVVWVLGLSRTHHGVQLHRRCRELGIPYIDTFRIPHPNTLAARITECRLLDAILKRRDRIEGQTPLVRTLIGGAA